MVVEVAKPIPIINTHDQLVAAKGDRIAITYTGWGSYRSMNVPCWQVYHVVNGRQIPTDPNAAWYEHRLKTFYLSNGPVREQKPVALAKVIKWADRQYGKRTYVRNRMGDMVEQEVNERFPIPLEQRG